LEHETAEGWTVVAADISEKMLAMARCRLGTRAESVHLRHMDAESMPAISDASVDAYSMSLVMKICDRRRALDEAFRVLPAW
jgi:ubiquinone/menaquinone biosynthesis C-methylase UbiE